MKKQCILSIFGTRPEVIKMAPVIRALENDPTRFESIVCSTGQHREMLSQMTSLFSLRCDVELDIMRPDQTLSSLTARLIDEIDRTILQINPDWILAQGDTTTVLAAAIAAFYRRVPFAHVEAGLRTHNLAHPFPEEFNRITADSTASLLFAPTSRSAANLIAEGKPQHSVRVTGNTVIDSLQFVAGLPYSWEDGPLKVISRAQRIVLVTAHRRESFGDAFRDICAGIAELARRFPDVQFVYPVHLNPNVQTPVNATLGMLPNVALLPPLDYVSLVNLLKHSILVLTDSGGFQEEAPGMKVPVLVMRETTERPEGVDAGVVRLVGTATKDIVDSASQLLTDPAAHSLMANGANPYGDGKASERIVGALASWPSEVAEVSRTR